MNVKCFKNYHYIIEPLSSPCDIKISMHKAMHQNTALLAFLRVRQWI